MAEIGTPCQAMEAVARLAGNVMAMLEVESEHRRAVCGSGTH